MHPPQRHMYITVSTVYMTSMRDNIPSIIKKVCENKLVYMYIPATRGVRIVHGGLTVDVRGHCPQCVPHTAILKLAKGARGFPETTARSIVIHQTIGQPHDKRKAPVRRMAA